MNHEGQVDVETAGSLRAAARNTPQSSDGADI